MPGKITAKRVRVACRHGHLADAIQQRHAHGDQRGAIAVMEVQEVVGRPLALADLEA